MIKFTKEEKIILLFLLASLFIGTFVLYYKKITPSTYRIVDFDEKDVQKSKKININKATQEDLIKLNNIGPVLAGRILSYREKYGPFKREEDIKNVKGIGEKTYEKMKKQIVLE